MSNTFTNNENENFENREDDNLGGGPFVIPKRRGSKYADILLQRLQTTLLANNEPVVVGMLGIAPRQGVTTMSANLAIRAADHFYKPSLMIDGNTRNQKITRMYRIRNKGLAECLNGQASLEQCTKETKVSNCFVMGAGDRKLSRQIMFDPDIAGGFFKVVRNDFRFTVMDLPALNEPSYVESILPFLDAVVLVARYGVRREQLEFTQQLLNKSRVDLAAVVMTGNDDKLPGWVPQFFG